MPPAAAAPAHVPPPAEPNPVPPIPSASGNVATSSAHLVDETAFVDVVVVGPATPFENVPRRAEPPPSSLTDSFIAEVDAIRGGTADAVDVVTDAEVRASRAGEPPFLAGPSHAGDPPTGHPPAGHSPAGYPPARLALEQYASLMAELTVLARPRDQTLLRYGLDEAELVATKGSFNRRFADDPALYGRYRRAYDAYLQWLSQTPPR
ncbi:MAG: hypothetical protein AAF715_23705 [Myxococcota bacterium]